MQKQYQTIRQLVLLTIVVVVLDLWQPLLLFASGQEFVVCYVCDNDPTAIVTNPDAQVDISFVDPVNIPPGTAVFSCQVLFDAGLQEQYTQADCDAFTSNDQFQSDCGCQSSAIAPTQTPAPIIAPTPTITTPAPIDVGTPTATPVATVPVPTISIGPVVVAPSVIDTFVPTSSTVGPTLVSSTDCIGKGKGKGKGGGCSKKMKKDKKTMGMKGGSKSKKGKGSKGGGEKKKMEKESKNSNESKGTSGNKTNSDANDDYYDDGNYVGGYYDDDYIEPVTAAQDVTPSSSYDEHHHETLIQTLEQATVRHFLYNRKHKADDEGTENLQKKSNDVPSTTKADSILSNSNNSKTTATTTLSAEQIHQLRIQHGVNMTTATSITAFSTTSSDEQTFAERLHQRQNNTGTTSSNTTIDITHSPEERLKLIRNAKNSTNNDTNQQSQQNVLAVSSSAFDSRLSDLRTKYNGTLTATP